MPINKKWTYNPIPGYQFVVRIEDEIGGMMLVATHIKPGQEPEARRALTLAAAAPELYAALAFADILIEFMLRKADKMSPTLAEAFRQTYVKAEAALLKANPARGEQTK